MRVTLLLILLAFAVEAEAALKFCNDTDVKVTVAIAYAAKDPSGVSTSHSKVLVEGWWSFDPGECAQVRDVSGKANWLYYYAHSKNGQWTGTAWACTKGSEFKLEDIFRREGERCPAAGWSLRGFKRIDTDATTYTLHLKP